VDSELAVKVEAEPVGIPSDPVLMQEMTVEVMSDGKMNIRTKPPLPQWSILGLAVTMVKNLGG
jgi:hypothetical protein